jgi:glycosyltransferase involved in cell wall biosynthesis
MDEHRLTTRSAARRDALSIALIGNYSPRQCGIATFTTDLREALVAQAPDADCWAVVVNDTPQGYDYPPAVRFEINQKSLADYRRATDYLNINQVDVVCVQHEFGIFGGEHGRYVLELIEHLRMPVIATLHTVLGAPEPGQRAVIERLAARCDRLVVMSERAIALLGEVYGVPREKIALIPHGVPDLPFVDPNYYKDQFGVQGRKVILTFGLLSPNKGIETMIEALPEIVARHPDTVYVILGATHPHVRRREGEAYRLALQRRARALQVDGHIIFHNRFVSQQELAEFLGAADIYVTPYPGREQIASGTLAYALGAGKAVVSTPYWYAEEMLAEGRGRLVPFRDPHALAAAIIELFDNEVERHAMRKRAHLYCRRMVWSEVGRSYLELFADARRQRALRGPGVAFPARTLEAQPFELPPPKFDHLLALTDDVGILQHASFAVPDRDHGYCTDDNARALVAVLAAQDVLGDDPALDRLAARYLSFLAHAFNGTNGRFRNFLGYDRRWLEEAGSDDSHGRALWALGRTIVLARRGGISGLAVKLFERALPALARIGSPRAWAFALLGLDAYLRRFGGDSEARRARAQLFGRLAGSFASCAAPDWPWPEERLTYANALLPHALLVTGRELGAPDAVRTALAALDWLCRLQTDPQGHFVPIGNRGWYARGGQRARFDQQPIEAQHMVEACVEAYQSTGDPKWLHEARRAFEWFLGRNDLQAALYDHETGGCRDGLSPEGASQNEGAESALAWQGALLALHALDAKGLLTHRAESARRERATAAAPEVLQ